MKDMSPTRRRAARGSEWTAVLLCIFIVAGWLSSLAAASADTPVILDDSYIGRERDAPWRETAEQHIERYRKGNLAVIVRDRDGKLLPGADVSIQMTRHAFRFGSRADVRLINSDEVDAQKYREHFLEFFNYATVNTVYYFQWRTPKQSREILQATLDAIPWLEKHDYPMRGHTLVWWFRDENIKRPAREVHDRVVQHIYQTAGNPMLAAAFDEWDVQNEPYGNSEIFRKLGRESLTDFYGLVHKLDPDATLYLNEASLISQMHKKDWKQRQDFIYDLVKDLLDKGVPVHGLGFQSHHIQKLSPIPEVIKTLDRFATLGVDMQVTEYDIKLRPAPNSKDFNSRWRAPADTTPELEQLEAEYMRDFLTAVFSHPGMNAFIMWGFWDGRHWLYNGPLFRKDWTLKPAGQAYKDLVFGEWWTRESGRTDKDGRLEKRCFLGNYEIAVTHGGESKTVETALPSEGATVTLTLQRK